MDRTRVGRRGLWAAAAGAALLVLGIVLISHAVAGQQNPPQPSQAAGSPPPAHTTSSAPVVDSAVLPPSAPTALSVPAIGVNSPLITLGQNPDGTLQVPQPGPDYDKAAWYRYSPHRTRSDPPP